jgi:DNA modification methylase
MIEAPDIRPPESAVTAEAKGCSLHSLVPQPFYDVDGITIYCGDNRQIMPLIGGADLLLTDPPYGINADAKMAAAAGTQYGTALAKKRDYGTTNWDACPPQRWALEQAMEKAKWQIIWGGNYFGLPAARCWLVWDKEINGEFADCELAWTNLDKPVKKIRHMWNGMLRKYGEAREHPTQKPQDVILWCLGHVPEAKTVLDPWMGSGTTLVAAKLLGLRAIGIEANETYCKLAVARLAQGVLGLGNREVSDKG